MPNVMWFLGAETSRLLKKLPVLVSLMLASTVLFVPLGTNAANWFSNTRELIWEHQDSDDYAFLAYVVPPISNQNEATTHEAREALLKAVVGDPRMYLITHAAAASDSVPSQLLNTALVVAHPGALPGFPIDEKTVVAVNVEKTDQAANSGGTPGNAPSTNELLTMSS